MWVGVHGSGEGRALGRKSVVVRDPRADVDVTVRVAAALGNIRLAWGTGEGMMVRSVWDKVRAWVMGYTQHILFNASVEQCCLLHAPKENCRVFISNKKNQIEISAMIFW